MKMNDKKHYSKDYIKPQKLTYSEFPQSNENPKGMKILKPSLKNIYPKIKFDITYAKKSNKDLHIDIILPPRNNKEIYPLIMWAQGSAFHKQNLGDHFASLVDVAKQGYVVAVVQYRWAPEDSFPVQIRDFNTATRFMLNHANEYNIDSSNYLAWGDSSGAHTAVMSAMTQNEQYFSDEDISVFPLKFKGCIDYYGPTDIDKMNKALSTQDHVTSESLEGEFFGTRNIYEIPETVQKANPLNYIDKNNNIPPILIMHGNKDRLVPFNQSVRFYEKLLENQKKVEFYSIWNSDHGSDSFFSPEVLNVTYDFISNCLNNRKEI